MSRSTKTRARKTPKPKPTPAVLPVRPHPDFITEAQINAAYHARLAGLPHTAIRAWTPTPDGNTVYLAFPSGNRIHHTKDGFTAITPCAQGHPHQTPITNRDTLNAAIHTAAQCTNLHGRPRILTTAQAAATTDDTQTLDVTDLRADHENAQDHPETTPGYNIALAAAEAHATAAARHQENTQ